MLSRRAYALLLQKEGRVFVKGSLCLISLLIAGAIASAACASSTPASAGPSGSGSAGAAIQCVDTTIAIAGSTALQPLIQDAANAYMDRCPKAAIVVNGGGSGTGLSEVAQGAVDIGSSDVLASDKLSGPQAGKLVDHVVAKQGWIVVTNKDVTGVTNLTSQQEQDIWSCKITNWKDVGGPDMPIILIYRPASSGTRAVFRQIVLKGETECTTDATTLTEDSNGAVTTGVTKTDGAISVIGFAYYNDPINKASLDGLQLDGVDATIANVTKGTYKLAADGHLYTNGPAAGLAAAFLDFMKSDEVQKTIIPKDSYGSIDS